jgi:hypothetical protein
MLIEDWKNWPWKKEFDFLEVIKILFVYSVIINNYTIIIWEDTWDM